MKHLNKSHLSLPSLIMSHMLKIKSLFSLPSTSGKHPPFGDGGMVVTSYWCSGASQTIVPWSRNFRLLCSRTCCKSHQINTSAQHVKCNRNERCLSQLSALSILDEPRCGVVRPRHSANFICLNRATSLRLVLSVVVTVMSSEICERPADSSLCTDDREDWLEEY